MSPNNANATAVWSTSAASKELNPLVEEDVEEEEGDVDVDVLLFPVLAAKTRRILQRRQITRGPI